MKKIVIFSLFTLLVSCFATETKNPEKAYKYWSGTESPKEIKLIKGEYYKSPHFFLEYELFLKFKSDKKWFDEFVESNELEIDTTQNDWSEWIELPIWFKIDINYVMYSKNQNDEFERSRYFINPENGMCYIYETVGM